MKLDDREGVVASGTPPAISWNSSKVVMEDTAKTQKQSLSLARSTEFMSSIFVNRWHSHLPLLFALQ